MRPSDFLSSLPPDRLTRLASVYSDLAFASGLAITREDGVSVPIPAVLSPVVLPSEEIERRAALASRVAAAIARTARGLLTSPRRSVILDCLAPLERTIVERTHSQVDRVANARVDFFADAAGELKALELNATIPAMHAYSDIVAQSFVRAVGHERSLSQRTLAELTATNGSNSLALLQALLECYRARGGGRPAPSIALCARRNDPQLTELGFLARAFTSLGYPSFVVPPDELSIEGDEIHAGTRRVDLLYRHVFERRIEEDTALSRILMEPSRYMVFNPVNPQLEVKTTLAELSAAAHDARLAKELGLTDDDVAVARAHIPWTRRLLNGPSTGPKGDRIEDLTKLVSSQPSQFVIKRAWGWGGKAAFVGRFAHDTATQQRVKDAFGEPMPWSTLVSRAAADTRGGGFVVQEYVDSPKRDLTLCDANGRTRVESMYLDFSAFTSIGFDTPGWSGVCRASASPTVNLLAGGAVVPLLREEVSRALFP